MQELSLENWEKDPKTRLQELLQARQMDVPNYTLVSQKGLPHEQTFHVECSIVLSDKNLVGTGASRKKAEQHAAELMLAQIARKTK